MTQTRRDFLRLAPAMLVPWVLPRSGWRDGSGVKRIVLLRGDGTVSAARGLRLGAEEATRMAELLGTPLSFLEADLPAAEAPQDAVLGWVDRGAVGAIGPFGAIGGAELGIAAARAGIVSLDVTSPHEGDDTPELFRVAAPTRALGLSLLRVLAREAPDRGWLLVGDGSAPRRFDIEAALGRSRFVPLDGARPSPTEIVGRLEDHRLTGVVLVGGASALRDEVSRRRPELLVLDVERGRALGPGAGGLRAALWDASLFRYGAEQLNERFRRRFEAPMDGPAWAAWMAVKALSETVLRLGDASGAAVASRLVDPETAFDGHKGVPLKFGADRQLIQPLYVVGGSGPVEVPWPLGESS